MTDPCYQGSKVPRNRIWGHFLRGGPIPRFTPEQIQDWIDKFEDSLEKAETAGDVENIERYAAVLVTLRESKKKAEQGVDP